MLMNHYITISNGLLKDGHRKRMGSAVWEFMWCLDKVTRIDEDGTGWILGGKPIMLKEISEDLSVNTISENIDKLEKEGYIRTQRTAYGQRIWVLNTKKKFIRGIESSEKRDSPSEKVDSPSENRDSNKTVTVDTTVDSELSYESEEVTSKQYRKQQAIKNKTNLTEPAIEYYKAKTKEAFDFIPGVDMGGRTMLSHFLKEHSMEEWKDYIDYYYNTPKTPFYEEKMTPDLKVLLSTSFINQWKQNKIK